MDTASTSTSDHDLLIQLNVNVTSMRDEMRQSNTQLNGQIADHETRIRILERHDDTNKGSKQGVGNSAKWMIAALGAIAAVVEPIIMVYLGTKN